MEGRKRSKKLWVSGFNKVYKFSKVYFTMKKRSTIFYFLVFVAIVISFSPTNFVAGQDSEQFSVELNIPDYIPNADSLRHPTKFFSGREIKIIGDFSDTSSVKLELRGSKIGTRKILEVKKATLQFISTEIPADVPTDTYTLMLTLNKQAYKIPLDIIGVSASERMIGGGGAIEERPDAILYDSSIPCCAFEMVLGGHPKDPNYLIIAANSPFPYVSHDGARSWQKVSLNNADNFRYLGDSNIVVTPEGKALLVADIYYPSSHVGGALFIGDMADNILDANVIVEDNPIFIFFDYPKITYDEPTKNIYIVSILNNLFISSDGKSFSKKDFEIRNRVGAGVVGVGFITDIQTTPTGALRAVIIENLRDYKCQVGLLRFDGEANFDIAGPESTFFCTGVARVSSTTNRADLIYYGPMIAIDKSSKHLGRIYASWAQASSIIQNPPNFEYNYYGENFDIFFAYSDDDGTSWSTPQRVNDDNTKGDQTFPSMAIDSEGDVHIAFLDKRENPDPALFDIYYAKIVDGQVSKNIRINPIHVPNAIGGRFPGDYLDMIVAYPEKAYVGYPCGGNENTPTNACVTAIDPKLVPLPFIRGDSNSDGHVDLSDAIYILHWTFLGEQGPECWDRADANDDGLVDISDPVAILLYLFKGENPPAAPYPDAGFDTTADELTC